VLVRRRHRRPGRASRRATVHGPAHRRRHDRGRRLALAHPVAAGRGRRAHPFRRPRNASGPDLEETIMTTATPVIFIHGLWLHATSWAAWVDLFRQAGYAPQAPGWPGDPDTVEAARANPESLADHGIDDVDAHYAKIIAGLDAAPVLIGHSFG